MPSQEQLEIARLKKQIADSAKLRAIEPLLEKAGANKLCAKLISLDLVLVDESTGQVFGAEQAIAEFKLAQPAFFKQAIAPNTAPPASAPLTKPNQAPAPETKHIRDMTEQEYQDYKTADLNRQEPTKWIEPSKSAVANLSPEDYEAAKMKAIYSG